MKKGFTLAEVLITLAIIGVVAALTIPTVIRNYQETQTVSAVKKFYSEISQAFKLAEIQNGPIDTWDWGESVASGTSAVKIMNIIYPYMKITKNCGMGAGCFLNKPYKSLGETEYLNPETRTDVAKARLANGMSFWIYTSGGKCNVVSGTSKAEQNVCGYVAVDINGDKMPHQTARDMFPFRITKYGIIPYGTATDTLRPLADFCNRKSTNYEAGRACTAWIIAKGNMDYLRRDVNW